VHILACFSNCLDGCRADPDSRVDLQRSANRLSWQPRAPTKWCAASALEAREIKAADNLVSFVEGDIEDVEGVLKITKIRVTYHLKIPREKSGDAREAFSEYLTRCPAAQSVIGCIQIQDDLRIEEEGA
jgi:hypothetical protein